MTFKDQAALLFTFEHNHSVQNGTLFSVRQFNQESMT